MQNVLKCVKSLLLNILAECLFASSFTLTFLRTWVSGHKGQCYFHGSSCWQNKLCCCCEPENIQGKATCPGLLGGTHKVQDTKYALTLCLAQNTWSGFWFGLSFLSGNMESSTVCWRSALLATAFYPSLYPLSVPTLISSPYVYVGYSWKVSSLELFPEDT